MDIFDQLKNQALVYEKVYAMWDKGETLKIPRNLSDLANDIAKSYIFVHCAGQSAVLKSPKVEIIDNNL